MLPFGVRRLYCSFGNIQGFGISPTNVGQSCSVISTNPIAIAFRSIHDRTTVQRDSARNRP